MSTPPPIGAAAAHHRPMQAIALMVLAMLVLPGMDAIAKWLSASLSAGQLSWVRLALQSILMLPFFLQTSGVWSWEAVGINAVRGALVAVATLCFITALQHMPIVDALAVFFVEPLILTGLAALFLGERIGWRRISAAFAGFAGALLVIRPNFEVVGWPAALPLGSAVLFSAYLILTRRLSQQEDPVRMQFTSGVLGAVFMTVVLCVGAWAEVPLLAVATPTAFEWLLLLGLGITSAVGHLLVVYAFQRAPAATLAPFQFTEIVGATILGLLVFGDFPDPQTWAGIVIIVASGIYVLHRERVRRDAAT